MDTAQIVIDTKNSSPLIQLFDVRRYYAISLDICQQLDIGDIVSLSRTHISLSTIYQNLLPILWNVDRSLKRFVENPKGLRSQLAVNDAMIAGSFVLRFLDRKFSPDGALDIFQSGQPGDEDAESALVTYLQEEEGYHLSAETRLFHPSISMACFILSLFPLVILSNRNQDRYSRSGS